MEKTKSKTKTTKTKTATTKKTTPKKELVVDKEDIIVEETEVVEATEVIVEEKPQRLSGRMRKSNDGINTEHLDKSRKVPVISIKSGTVGYKCQLTPNLLIWREYGDEHMMSIGELLVMYAQYKGFLTKPYILVDDLEFSEALKLTDTYEVIFDTEDLVSFYNSQLIKIKRKLADLPNGVRKEVLNRTIKMINEGELNNLAVVRLLKDEYNIDIQI